MIKQGIVNDSILEKKFKILRTSILLGNATDKDELLRKYEKSAREVDGIKRDVYEELLAGKIYTTTTLEEEQSRLKNLITFIENRVKERNDFIDDYLRVTTKFLDDLPKVSLENELPNYKSRLDNIDEYLNNCNEIEKYTNKLKSYRDKLEEKYENKANNEIINSKLEDELLEEFNKVISEDEYYANLNYPDIEDEINKLDNSINEKFDIMNTFISSYEALINAGISGSERDEYFSYVKDSQKEYYNDLEKKYILDMYKLILDKQNNYDSLYEKRQNIDNILKERNQKRQELNITTRDQLLYFVDLCNEQFSVIKSQKYNIENIDKLVLDISECETKLENLQKANQRREIVDLLDEYSIKNQEIEKIEIPEEKEIYDEIVKDTIETIPKADNMVVKVRDPDKIDIKKATDTAKLVMKKVVIVLEPKKFSRKKDKSKEPKEIIEESKEQKEIIEENKEPKEVKEKKETKKGKKKDDIYISSPTINIDIRTVQDNKSEENGNTLDKIKIHIPKPEEISAPTTNISISNKDIFVPKKDITIAPKIIVEDKKEQENKNLDIFNETDPFLDDNQFELNHKKDEFVAGAMPQIEIIGTVKPNNILSKLDDVSKGANDIILPSMGLSDDEIESIPIVSENYIN